MCKMLLGWQRNREWDQEGKYVSAKATKRSHGLGQTMTARQVLLLSKSQRAIEHWDHTVCSSTNKSPVSESSTKCFIKPVS